MTDLSREIVRKYASYDATSRKHDERKGRERFTSSAMSSMILDNMIEEVVGEASMDAAGYFEHAIGEEARLQSVEGHHAQRLTQTLYNERDQSKRALQQQLQILDQTNGPRSARHIALSEDRTSAEEALSRVKSRLDRSHRPLNVHFTHVYLPVLLLFAVGEAPLNRLSFELFFEDAQWVAWLMAFLCGGALMCLAHLAGVGVRQFKTRNRSALAILGNIVGLCIVLFPAGVLLYVIAILRQGYFTFISADTGGDVSSNILATGHTAPEQMLTVIATTNLGATGLQYLAINAVIVILGALLAFFRHDPERDYEPAVRRYDKAKRALRLLNEVYGRGVNRANQAHATTLAEVNRDIADTEQRLEDAHNALERLRSSRLPDLLVVARGVLLRARVQLGGYYGKAGEAGVNLPSYTMPTEDAILTRLESQGLQRRPAQAARTQRPANDREEAMSHTVSHTVESAATAFADEDDLSSVQMISSRPLQ